MGDTATGNVCGAPDVRPRTVIATLGPIGAPLARSQRTRRFGARTSHGACAAVRDAAWGAVREGVIDSSPVTFGAWLSSTGRRDAEDERDRPGLACDALRGRAAPPARGRLPDARLERRGRGRGPG